MVVYGMDNTQNVDLNIDPAWSGRYAAAEIGTCSIDLPSGAMKSVQASIG